MSEERPEAVIVKKKGADLALGVAIGFMLMIGFLGFLAVIFGYLRSQWFLIVFGSFTAGLAACGILLIALLLRPKTESPP